MRYQNITRVCLFILLLAAGWGGARAQAAADTLSSLRWVDAKTLGIEGRGWASGTETPFDRLPARAKAKVRADVWTLSQDSSGMLVRFRSDTGVLGVRWTVRKENRLAMGHMPATGVSGVDLYSKDGDTWRWVAGGGRILKRENEAVLFLRKPWEPRDYLLYLPLYNGVVSLELGVESSAAIGSLARQDKPVVFYGTSITQGGCASRPGMAYPAILGRRLDVPTVNLGFSGNALTEPEVVDLLAELDPAVFVLDSLPNLRSEEVEPRLTHAVRTLRAKHPKVPIVLVESIHYGGGWFNAQPQRRHTNSSAALRGVYERFAREDPLLFYIEGKGLLGDDGEATVDGSHPTDLGFLRIAGHMEPVLRQALALAPR